MELVIDIDPVELFLAVGVVAGTKGGPVAEIQSIGILIVVEFFITNGPEKIRRCEVRALDIVSTR